MGSQENRAALEAALEAFNVGDFATYSRLLYDPGAAIHGFGPETLEVEGMLRFYETVAAGFSGVSVTVEDVVAEGERLAARYTFRGSHTGEFMGLPATGRAVEVPGQTILRFEGGKVVERWQSFDTMSLMQQLGAVPAPA